MITSLVTALTRVTFFWYILGVLILFLGDPQWAERAYARLSLYPFVPELEFRGLTSAARVQYHLVLYWTFPLLVVWGVSLLVGAILSEVYCRVALRKQVVTLQPSGEFWGVFVPSFSLGALPLATTPALTGAPVRFEGATPADPANKISLSARLKSATPILVQGAMRDAVKLLTPAERALCEELIQLLLARPNHYAGLGHGVGLLEHTLNVASEAALKCTAEFRLPLLAALSHDVGKLITFQPDGEGGWVRKGLHSRESGRILATLPSFQALPELHQRALILAVKYDHAPSKMPMLRGDREATQLAMRIISALSAADRNATAAEKERHLERIQPEDLLWQDFMTYLREAPVVQRGKKGAANQVNNPPDSPYLFIYEAPWREEAVRRLPPEVAAALDLNRRDPGKLAKYTRILLSRLRKEGLLVEEHQGQQVSEGNPLWDIQSGSGEKAVVLRGIIVLQADALWKLVNYRLSVRSPFQVQILAPNADEEGAVRPAPAARRELPPVPDVSDGMKIDALEAGSMAALGLMDETTTTASGTGLGKARARSRAAFKAAPAAQDDTVLGLTAESHPPRAQEGEVQATQGPVAAPTVESPEAATLPVAKEPGEQEEAAQAAQEAAELAALLANDSPSDAPFDFDAGEENHSLNSALDLVGGLLVADPEDAEPATKAEDAAESAVLMITETATPLTPAESVAPRTRAPASESNTEPLSRAEKREGLAVADEAACLKYPHLSVGDKYYTAHSREVERGRVKEGQRFQGGGKPITSASPPATPTQEKAAATKPPVEAATKPRRGDLALTDSGPRRGRRRF